MDTEVWGPAAWLFIHSIALAYPDQNPEPEIRENYKKFFDSLVSVLPCAYCRNHYKENISSLPLASALDSRASLFRWTVDLHNRVNQSLHKPLVGYAEALSLLQGRFNSKRFNSTQQKATISIFLLLGIVLTGGYVYFRCRKTRL